MFIQFFFDFLAQASIKAVEELNSKKIIFLNKKRFL